MKVITITNEKGGVAKTTTALNLAYGLANQGYKILCIDLDTQQSLSMLLNKQLNTEYTTIYDLLNQENIKECISVVSDNVSVIYGDERLRNEDYINDLNALKEALKSVNKTYDYCIIDTPPLTRKLNLLALNASDEVLIPVKAEKSSIQGLLQTYKTINTIKDINKKIKIKGVVLVMYENRSNYSKHIKESLKDICKQLKIYMFDTTIRRSVKLAEAESNNKAIYDYDKKALVAQDYIDFVNEFLNI